MTSDFRQALYLSKLLGKSDSFSLVVQFKNVILCIDKLLFLLSTPTSFPLTNKKYTF
jgi:hypothetical protein